MKKLSLFIDPQGAEHYNQQGCKLISQRRFFEALANLEHAQKLDPFNPGIHQNKAVSLYFLERFTEALQHCNFAIHFHPSLSNLVLIYQLKGDIFYALGKLQDALEYFQKSLDLNPHDFHAIHPHYRKGLVLAKLGRYQEALDACENILRLNPNHVAMNNLKLEIIESFEA